MDISKTAAATKALELSRLAGDVGRVVVFYTPMATRPQTVVPGVGGTGRSATANRPVNPTGFTAARMSCLASDSGQVVVPQALHWPNVPKLFMPGVGGTGWSATADRPVNMMDWFTVRLEPNMAERNTAEPTVSRGLAARHHMVTGVAGVTRGSCANSVFSARCGWNSLGAEQTAHRSTAERASQTLREPKFRFDLPDADETTKAVWTQKRQSPVWQGFTAKYFSMLNRFVGLATMSCAQRYALFRNIQQERGWKATTASSYWISTLTVRRILELPCTAEDARATTILEKEAKSAEVSYAEPMTIDHYHEMRELLPPGDPVRIAISLAFVWGQRISDIAQLAKNDIDTECFNTPMMIAKVCRGKVIGRIRPYHLHLPIVDLTYRLTVDLDLGD